MTRQIALFLSAAAILGCTSAAVAGKIHVTADGLDFHMKAGDLPGLFSNAGGHDFTGPELRDVHQSLNNAGISTDGMVTFVLANTNAGLTMFALVDSNMPNGPKNANAMLGINTTTQGADGYVNNDNNFMDNGGTFADDGSSQTLAGEFFWHPDGGATGMAWTAMNGGDTGSFDFTAFMGEDGMPSTFAGLNESDTFQFVSWTGTTWNSKRLAEFDGSGSFSVAFAVVPVPPALALGLAGIGIVAVTRRRRKKSKA